MNKDAVYPNSFKYKVIYVFSKPNNECNDCYKIGQASIDLTEEEALTIPDNDEKLNNAAIKRIKEYTLTNASDFELKYTTIGLTNNKLHPQEIKDTTIHQLLKHSGISNETFHLTHGGHPKEWFKLKLTDILNAIFSCKEGKTYIDKSQPIHIKFRPEQEEAINAIINSYKNGNKRFLLNAKMRFGKTLCTMEVIKRSNFKNTLIVTHKPSIVSEWQDNYNLIFQGDKNYEFISKTLGAQINNLNNDDQNKVVFASIQDLMGSKFVNGKYEKNEDLFLKDWNFVIIDEAHEGIKTAKANPIINHLIKNAKVLYLSGTPFKIIDDFKQDQVFIWDYVKEQQAKLNWNKEHLDETNPYLDLPSLHIYTFELAKKFNKYVDENLSFNLNEFLRVYEKKDLRDTNGNLNNNIKVNEFVHKDDVWKFLDLISTLDENSNYPYSTQKYRDNFKHTLWVIPGVKEANALKKLLEQHKYFSNYKIINVAGNEYTREFDAKDAKKVVLNQIGPNPNETRTITLSCERLTTGVTIGQWNAVFMLFGKKDTSATFYLQTMFRVQSAFKYDGKTKSDCFCFDFAPDRCLQCISESIENKHVNDKNSETKTKKDLEIFLNYCPIIAFNGNTMKLFKSNELMQTVQKYYAERIVQNGFKDSSLFNWNLIDDISDEEYSYIATLHSKLGNKNKETNKITINEQGLDNEQKENTGESKEVKELNLIKDEEDQTKKANEENKKRARLIKQTLFDISIRIPLIVYGTDTEINSDFDINEFMQSIDDYSWNEFMPSEIKKKEFSNLAKYFRTYRFIAAANKIRQLINQADQQNPEDRIQYIVKIFQIFHNPDKETVLTPWNVVNLHLSETIGGYCFYDFKKDGTYLQEHPILIETSCENEKITQEILFNNNTRILEINAKSGLYPLYVTYSIYKHQTINKELNNEEKWDIWKNIIAKNIFIICKSKMAKAIVKKTLLGNKQTKINTHVFNDFVSKLQEGKEDFLKKIITPSWWNKNESSHEQLFDVVIGNPPYQQGQHNQIYPFFYINAKKIGKFVSLIFPKNWQEAKDANNLKILNNAENKYDRQIIFIDNRYSVFKNVNIDWVNIVFWKKGYNNGFDGYQRILTNGKNENLVKLKIRKEEITKPEQLIELRELVKRNNFDSFSNHISRRKPYGMSTLYKEYENKDGFLKQKTNSKNLIRIHFKKDFLYIKDVQYLPKVTKSLSKYKVFVPYAWGGNEGSKFLGGTYANIKVVNPNEACSETYLETGCFEKQEDAKKHAKYMMTRFFRALLFLNKFSRHSTTAFGDIPYQNYSEEWWNLSIAEIEEKLFDKYNVPDKIRKFIKKKIQQKYETNILISNFGKK